MISDKKWSVVLITHGTQDGDGKKKAMLLRGESKGGLRCMRVRDRAIVKHDAEDAKYEWYKLDAGGLRVHAKEGMREGGGGLGGWVM